MSAPWFKFYPSDWRADPALRMCCAAARGLWMEMLCLMHEATPRGSLLINGNPVSERQLANLSGIPPREVAVLLTELEEAGVFSREDNRTIFSRRMRRDDEKANRDKANGKGGGNPHLKRGVNPQDNRAENRQDKAQKPEARTTEADASGGKPPPDPAIEKRDLFDRGKSVLGKSAGGLITDLLKAKGGNVALARAAIEQASQAQDCREYVGRIINQKPQAPGGSNGADVVSAGARVAQRIRDEEQRRNGLWSEQGSGSGYEDVRLLASGGSR